MIIQKTEPKGIDKAIDMFQSYLYNALGFTNWECYPRIYSIPTSGNSSQNGLIPAHFINGVDYEEVYMNDEFDLSTFFYTNSDVSFENQIGRTKVSLICQVKLDELFPTITHRADEEFNMSVVNASNNFYGYEMFTLTGIKKTINEVYKEFASKQVELTNMQPYYVVRFDFDVYYANGC